MASIETIRISGAERDKVLAFEEGHFLDLKAKEVAPAKLSRSLSAFANSSGGELYIGIGESKSGAGKVRQWRGFDDPEAANGHIQLFEQLLPLGQFHTCEFLESKGSPGLVLHATVLKSQGLTRDSAGVPYIRRGAQNLPVKGDEALQRLKLDKGIDSFERQTLSIESELVSESGTLGEFLKAIVPHAEPKSWLKKQLLVRDGKPVVASVLLFADEPQAALPKQSAIKIYRYKTSGEGTRDTLAGLPLTVEGALYDQIKLAVAETVALLEGIQKLGPRGLETISYPFETLHEIVTNAVLHRDYSLTSDVHIRIFDNRVEIESPGRLPGHVTTQNILTEQFARNGTIVRLINKFPDPPNKDVGEGLNTAFHAMSKLRLKPPSITENQNAVIVVIRHEPLASPEEAVMDYLESHNAITNRVARELTGITSENSMKNVFYRMRDSNLIERVEGLSQAAAAWRKKRDPAI